MKSSFAAAILVSLSAPTAAEAGPFDSAGGDDPTAASLVSLSLFSEQTAIPPAGETFHIGIHFEIQPGWHLYWKNPGDTGAPMVIDLNLPDGLTAGEVRWPAPRRYLHAGLLDYTYEDELILVIPIRVDERPPSGTINLDLEYLVCKEACLPGFADLSLSLPVADSPREVRPGPDAERFEQARASWPKPIDASAPAAPVQAAWRGETLVLRAPGADALEWYPDTPRHPQPPRIIEQGALQASALRIDYPAEVREASRVTGVLRVTHDGEDQTYEISLSPPGGG